MLRSQYGSPCSLLSRLSASEALLWVGHFQGRGGDRLFGAPSMCQASWSSSIQHGQEVGLSIMPIILDEEIEAKEG